MSEFIGSARRFRVVADGPLDETIGGLLRGAVEVLPWTVALEVLDNCMIAYGSGNSDGNRHSHDNLPILVAGKGGGSLKTGRHLRFPKETPVNNLWLSLLDRMGARLEQLGDSTGHLEGLS